MADSAKKKTAFGTLETMGMFAFGCVFAWHFAALFWAIPSAVDGDIAFAMQVLYLAGIALATWATSVLTRNKKFELFIFNPAVVVFSNVACCALPAEALVGAPTGLAAFTIFLSGALLVANFAHWESFSTVIRLSDPSAFVVIAIAIGGLLFAACRLLFPDQGAPFMLLLVLVNTFTALFVRNRTFRQERVQRSHSESRADWTRPDNIKISVVFGIVGVIFGYSWLLVLARGGTLWLWAILVGVVIVGVTLTLLRRTRFSIDVIDLERICIGAAAVFLIIDVAFADAALSLIATGLIVVVWFFFRAFNGGMLLRYALVNGFPASQYLAMGKIGTNFGMMIGWAIGWALLTEGWDAAHMTGAIAIVVVLAAVFFLPFEKRAETLKGVHAMTSSGEAITVSVNALNQIAEDNELSPREGEVLAYLARGHNSSHIAKKLFISENTAKAHIARIYRKLGVHSRQELIDLFESANE